MDHLIPQKGDCVDYFFTYIDKVDGDIVETLKEQRDSFPKYIAAIPDSKVDYAYADGKWTVKQALQHINDVERLFCYRMMALARGEEQPIHGMDQDAWANTANVSHRSLQDFEDEFIALRDASLAIIKSLRPEDVTRYGTVSDSRMCARAIPGILAGHVIHHKQILKDRYGL